MTDTQQPQFSRTLVIAPTTYAARRAMHDIMREERATDPRRYQVVSNGRQMRGLGRNHRVIVVEPTTLGEREEAYLRMSGVTIENRGI